MASTSSHGGVWECVWLHAKPSGRLGCFTLIDIFCVTADDTGGSLLFFEPVLGDNWNPAKAVNVMENPATIAAGLGHPPPPGA